MECGWGVSYKSRNDSIQEESHHQIPSSFWKLGICSTVWSTTCRQLSRLEHVPTRWLSWSKSLPGSPAVFCFFHTDGLVSVFQAACLICVCFAAFFLRSLLLSFMSLGGALDSIYYLLQEERSKQSAQFQGLPEFTFLLKELPFKIECFNLRVNCYTTISKFWRCLKLFFMLHHSKS